MLDLKLFEKLSIDFINNLLFCFQNKNLILDQLLEANDEKTYKWMFPDQKFISVDRDPRDIFVDYSKSNDVSVDVHEFIRLFKIKRYNIKESDSILRLKFEQLILEKENSMKKIKLYLNLSEKLHKQLLNYDMSESKKNIGIYKNYFDNRSIKIIEKSLSEYCFN